MTEPKCFVVCLKGRQSYRCLELIVTKRGISIDSNNSFYSSGPLLARRDFLFFYHCHPLNLEESKIFKDAVVRSILEGIMSGIIRSDVVKWYNMIFNSVHGQFRMDVHNLTSLLLALTKAISILEGDQR